MIIILESQEDFKWWSNNRNNVPKHCRFIHDNTKIQR